MWKTSLKEGQVTKAEIRRLFEYHKPTEEMQPRFQAIREAGYQLAIAINDNAPAGPDQSAAIRKVREAVMTANASIVLDY